MPLRDPSQLPSTAKQAVHLFFSQLEPATELFKIAKTLNHKKIHALNLQLISHYLCCASTSPEALSPDNKKISNWYRFGSYNHMRIYILIVLHEKK